MKKTCIIIAGPTAVGKTSLSIEVAKQLNTSIISADSRQCYRELTIGVAKPSKEELDNVPHYFINTHSVHDNVNAADFEKYALSAADDIFSKSDFVLMTGGTGLYINAFEEGLDAIPPTPAAIREDVIAGYEQNGMEWLQAFLQSRDPLFYSSGEMKNPQRMMRALEVVLHTGQSILTFRNQHKSKRNFNVVSIALELPREQLYERINLRVDNMINDGLEAEARSLLPLRNLNALQTVGYKELFDYFDGNISYEKAVELIKQNTRHYAKRQMTWFRREKGICFLPPDITQVMRHISDWLQTIRI